MLFAKKARWAVKSDLYRKYLAQKVARDLPRFARDQWEEFDPDDALRYIGLTTRKPARATFGGLGAFFLGCAIGGIAALMMAPRTGNEMRTNLKDKTMGYLGKQGVGTTSEKTASA